MKHLISGALALSLLCGTSALADPPDSSHHGSGGGQGGGQHNQPQGGGHPGGAPAGAPAARAPGPGGVPGAGGARGAGERGAPGGGQRPGGAPAYQGYQGGARGGAEGYRGAPATGARGAEGARGGERGAAEGARGGGERSGAEGARGGERGGGAAGHVPSTYHPRGGAPGFRPGGARPSYNARYFPRVYQSDRRYAWRGGVWRAQPGYYYRRWAYGERLPFGWFDSRWYIDDYYDYDLPVPPDGYEWVRVGPDALLVSLDDGTVVESAYGLFD
jgi:Ni/Co efflux regulator RcnB